LLLLLVKFSKISSLILAYLLNILAFQS